MAWVTLDDNAPTHHKMLVAGPAACWLWVCGIAYSQRHLTDGLVPDAALSMIGVRGESRALKLAAVLVDVRLFDRVDGGYRVHDYHAHNATADEAREHRRRISDRRAESGRVGGIRSGIARREATKQNGSNGSKQNEAPSHPTPYKNPPTPLADASGAVRLTRGIRKRAEEILRIRFGQCKHDPSCETRELCLVAIAAEILAKSA